MTHVRIETSVPRHRKFLAAGPAASWLWLAGHLYCREFKVLELPRLALPTLGQSSRADVEALEREGLWTPTERGWRVHVPEEASVGPRRSIPHMLRRLVQFWGERCAYCGVSGSRLQVEHIVPASRGGSDHVSNLTVACGPCNRRKFTRTAAEFGFPDIHVRAAEQ